SGSCSQRRGVCGRRGSPGSCQSPGGGGALARISRISLGRGIVPAGGRPAGRALTAAGARRPRGSRGRRPRGRGGGQGGGGRAAVRGWAPVRVMARVTGEVT